MRAAVECSTGMRWRHTAPYWDRLGQRNPFGVILTGIDRQPGEWDADAFFQTGIDDVARLMSELNRIAPDLGHQAALDFGCGVGRISRALSAHFDRVVGLDVASSMIAKAQQLNRAYPRCWFRVNRAARLRGVAPNSFDLVYCRLVLQHIPPPSVPRYLQELVRVLAPGGILMVQLPEPPEHDPDSLYLAEQQAFVTAPIANTPLKQIIPRAAIRTYRRLRFRRLVKRDQGAHRMYMFGMPRHEVVDVLRRAGVTIVRVDADQSHGNEVPGYVYWATKPDDPRRQ